MTIKASKPSINLREKLNELDQPRGIKGTELMRADTVAEARSLIGVGRKNLLINGGFDVWQRGTSSTVDDAYGTADRWFKYASGDTTSWGKGTDSTVGNYCTVTATSTGYCNLRQRVEGFHISGTTDFTLSFYMKGSVGGFPIRLEVYNLTDTNVTYGNTSIATGTTSWTKYTVTFQMDETDTYDNFHIMLGSNEAAASETLYLSQVQLEVGSVATDFEHRSYAEELALCQRYFFSSTHTSAHNTVCTYAHTSSNSEVVASFNFPVRMRIEPSCLVQNKTNIYFRHQDNTGFTLGSAGTYSNGETTDLYGNVWFNSQSSSGSRFGHLRLLSSGSKTGFEFDAEL